MSLGGLCVVPWIEPRAFSIVLLLQLSSLEWAWEMAQGLKCVHGEARIPFLVINESLRSKPEVASTQHQVWSQCQPLKTHNSLIVYFSLEIRNLRSMWLQVCSLWKLSEHVLLLSFLVSCGCQTMNIGCLSLLWLLYL